MHTFSLVSPDTEGEGCVDPKVILVDPEVIEAFLGESRDGHEQRWIHAEGWERKEWVFGAAPDDSEVFGEGGSNGMDLLGCFLVREGGDEGALKRIGSHAVDNIAFECVRTGCWRGSSVGKGQGESNMCTPFSR